VLCQAFFLAVDGAQAPAEEEEGTSRDANDDDGDDVFHACIIPNQGRGVKGKIRILSFFSVGSGRVISSRIFLLFMYTIIA